MTVMNDLDLALGSAEARGFMLAVARRIVRDEEDAADVTQEAMLLAYRHRESFRGDCSARTWLYRIATTTALGHLRRRKRSRERLAAEDAEVGTTAADPAPSPEDQVAAREVHELVRRAVLGLDDKYRRVLLMRVDETPETEVAATLGLSVANVKIRTFRARQQLRDALELARAAADVARAA
jgi:RNA polymerase sigma-70 factor (ECF subfamily)